MNNKHTGARATPKTKALITEGLAQGESVYSIARRLKVSMNTIVALKDTLWTKVENRRERIIAQAERNAELAAEQLTVHLENKHLPVNQLVPIFGVNVDKLASLRGDPTLVNVEHRHIHSIGADVYESLATLAQRLNDKAAQEPRKIEAITVEPTTIQDSQRNPKPSSLNSQDHLGITDTHASGVPTPSEDTPSDTSEPV